MDFRLVSSYSPRGDQATAIEQLVRGLKDAQQHLVLLGVTGSGKTFTMAKVIDRLKRPTLVLAHNKTLAAQLYHEFRGFFPENAVEYFVSYYDYYQPEAYIASTDTYIEKESTINDEIDRLRLSATRSLFERRDVVIVASVSCIYGLGSPEAYYGMLLMLEKGQRISRREILTKLVEILYEGWEALLEQQGRLLEAQRVHQRTLFDMEMVKEVGYCHGIENYSRHFTGRLPGQPPPTLLDYLPQDSLMFIDESHQTTPQLRGMYHGDRSRKENLVEYGFRLPSALDNRPLTFEEFEKRTNQLIYVSATPGPYELTKAGGVVVEQVIRPTGLTDPEVEVRPVRGQIDDLLNEIRKRAEKNERVLVTTLTKRMAEDLAEYYTEVGVRCRYLHSEIETLERIKILRSLRRGEFDVLIGINLLREGLDLPEVSLVAILDADKEGFLRSGDSLIQTMGRAARHINGRAILYADRMTDSMKRAIDETNRRRDIQARYNLENNITPESIIKPVDMTLVAIAEADYVKIPETEIGDVATEDPEKLAEIIAKLEAEMRAAAKKFEFERAAELRDKARELRAKVL